MSEISDDEASYNMPDDEVREIKRAMRVAKARKQSLSMQMKNKIDRNSADRSELESIIRKQSAELARTQSLLSQADFDLKEARYEINRINEREFKASEEKRIIETKSKDMVAELKHQLQQNTTLTEERNQVAVYECDKLIKTLTSLYKSVFDGRGSNALAPKTTKQLLDKATKDAAHLKDFLQSRSTVVLGEEQERISATLQSRTAMHTADQGCDNALLDMCRSLEEENRALADTVEALKVQLTEASRDASINRLIPHYRLAIVRSRTYAANLLEQVKREQATSQTLREQLDATYIDLKKVVEEKRRLFTRMSKFSLQQEEKDSFLAHQREVDERRILEASHTLASSPLRQQAGAAAGSAGESRVDPYSVAPAAITHLMGDRGSVPHAPNVPVASSAVPVGNYLSSGHTTSATAASVAPTVPRPTSPYLREVLQQPTRTASARTSTESNNVESLNSPSHLKAELSQLDVEIEQLKEKLGKAAMLRSQRILSEVLDSHAPVYHQ